MSILDDIRDKVLGIFNKELKSEFVQYHHISRKEDIEITCSNACNECLLNDLRIFKNDNKKPKVGFYNHKNCHCTYEEVEQKPVGSISKMGDLAPDVYLKRYGKLPDYYITKEEAKEKYGWVTGKNTMAGKVPGKMIGGNVFKNKNNILPVKEGRIWYECDVDYEMLKRNSKRLYYSNDGLMFYSETHDEAEVVQIK